MDALAFHVAATGGATTPANLGRLLLVCTAQFQPFLILFFFSFFCLGNSLFFLFLSFQLENVHLCLKVMQQPCQAIKISSLLGKRKNLSRDSRV
jgi:hypothetical protein